MNPQDKSGIGSRVREARQHIGLRQSDLSEQSGIPASHLSNIERGLLVPTIPTLARIGRILNRPLDYFLQDDTSKRRSMGLVINTSSVAGVAATRFAQRVEEKTNGVVGLHVFEQGTLGTATEQIRSLAEGAMDIYVDELHGFEQYAPLCGPALLPYFFRDRDHYNRFVRSDIFKTHLFQELLDNGIRLLNPASNWEFGSFDVIFSRDPIFTPADLVGRKFRSYESGAADALRRQLGADPVHVEWTHIDQAFEQGLVETVLVPAAHFYSKPFHRIAHYATVLRTGYTPNMTVAVNERGYSRLVPSVQRALAEAADEIGAEYSPLAQEETERELTNLYEAKGLPVIYSDQQVWRSAFVESIQALCEQGFLDHHLYQQLQDL